MKETKIDTNSVDFGSANRDNLLKLAIEAETARAMAREFELEGNTGTSLKCELKEIEVAGAVTNKHVFEISLLNKQQEPVSSFQLDAGVDYLLENVTLEKINEEWNLVFHRADGSSFKCSLKPLFEAAREGKIDLLGNEEISGEPYHFTYYYDIQPQEDKYVINIDTITLDNNKTLKRYSTEIPAATASFAGLMSKADKIKLEALPSAIAEKSKVSVSAVGTATDEVGYITIDGVEKKLAGGGAGGANKIKYDIPDRTGTVIDPIGILKNLYLNVDLAPAKATELFETLTYTEVVPEMLYTYTAFTTGEPDKTVIIEKFIFEGILLYAVSIGGQFISTATQDNGVLFITEGYEGYQAGFYTLEGIGPLGGVITLAFDENWQGITGAGAENDKLKELFSFNDTFSEEGSVGLLLYKDNTPIAGQASGQVKFKTINNISIIGSGNIEISGGGSTYTAGTGINIDDAKISVDTSVIATNNALDQGLAAKSKVIPMASGTATTVINYLKIDGTEYKIAGEPSQYLRTVIKSADEKTLTITKGDGASLNYNPTTEVVFSTIASDSGSQLSCITVGSDSWNILPVAPTVDGSYKLKCIVSDGVAAYSWELDQ